VARLSSRNVRIRSAMLSPFINDVFYFIHRQRKYTPEEGQNRSLF
jgi:hypothetical protein